MKCFLILAAINLLYCQDACSQNIITIIHGVKGDRPLIANDFTGTQVSAFKAESCITVGYKFKSVKLIGDTVYLDGVTVTIELVSGKSWFTKGNETQTSDLLKHEQGHFDMWRICAGELIKAYQHVRMVKYEFDANVNSIGHKILKKYQDLEAQYDEETNHGMIVSEQEKWNTFFKNGLSDQPPASGYPLAIPI